MSTEPGKPRDSAVKENPSAIPLLAGQFAIDPVHMGLVFSAFGWTCTPLQIPGGWLADRVRPRVL